MMIHSLYMKLPSFSDSLLLNKAKTANVSQTLAVLDLLSHNDIISIPYSSLSYHIASFLFLIPLALTHNKCNYLFFFIKYRFVREKH